MEKNQLPSNHQDGIKIICTIGPATESPEMLKKLADAGMNIARCNFSHGSHEEHGAKFARIREMNKKYGTDVKIMLDTKGPDIRLGRFANGEVVLKNGALFSLYGDERVGDEKGVSVTFKDLYKYVKKGNQIWLSSGIIITEVVDVKPATKEVVVKVIYGGKVSNNKCLTTPGVDIPLEFLREADIADLKYGVEQKVDMIAASFVTCAEDIRRMREIVGNIPIIAKIESEKGIKNVDEIIAEADGMMVARGGLGDNFPIEKVPTLQKMMIKKTNAAGKFIIVATEMALNMMAKPRPSRAEVNDIANAIYDGADAVMTSEETAIGEFPIETIHHMKNIAHEAWQQKYSK